MRVCVVISSHIQVHFAISEALRQKERLAWWEANTVLQTQVQELKGKLASAEAIINIQQQLLTSTAALAAL